MKLQEGVAERLFACPRCGHIWRPKVFPPNYCAKCKRPLSEKARETYRRCSERAALKKVSDVEKFKEMWFAGETYESIAEEFGLHAPEVYRVTVALKLPRRGSGFSPKAVSKRVRENERKVIDFLAERGGYCPYREATERLPTAAIQRLLYKRVVFKVCLSLKRSTGHFKRKVYQEIFEEEFVPRALGSKTFLCLGRTGVVRLMLKALKRPKDEGVKRTLTAFLRRYLTDAERAAVMWHLGVRELHSIRKSVRIPGGK